MGLNAVFFDKLQGTPIDKIFVCRSEDEFTVFITFETKDTIKISSRSEIKATWKSELSLHDLTLPDANEKKTLSDLNKTCSNAVGADQMSIFADD